MQGHTGAIIALSHVLVGDTLLLISSAEDQQVLVWECKLGSHQDDSKPYSQWNLQQKIEMGNGLQHCLAVTQLPDQPGWWAYHHLPVLLLYMQAGMCAIGKFIQRCKVCCR